MYGLMITELAQVAEQEHMERAMMARARPARLGVALGLRDPLARGTARGAVHPLGRPALQRLLIRR